MPDQSTDTDQKTQSTQAGQEASTQKSKIWILAGVAVSILAGVILMGIFWLNPNPSDKDQSCAPCTLAASQPAASHATSQKLDANKQASDRWTQEAGGQLGDFVGGIANPLLGFLTLLALIYTINLQRGQLEVAAATLKHLQDDLNSAREEVRLSREAREAATKQLERAAVAQEQAAYAHKKAAEAQKQSLSLKADELRMQHRAQLVERIDRLNNEIFSKAGKPLYAQDIVHLKGLEAEVIVLQAELKKLDDESMVDEPKSDDEA